MITVKNALKDLVDRIDTIENDGEVEIGEVEKDEMTELIEKMNAVFDKAELDHKITEFKSLFSYFFEMVGNYRRNINNSNINLDDVNHNLEKLQEAMDAFGEIN